MKQDPILPSIHVMDMAVPSQRMVPVLVKIGSARLVVDGFIAILLHCFCLLIAFWCMDIPHHNNPMHSTIEIAFEAPMVLPIPQEILNMDNETPVSLVEPSVSPKSLPQTDPIAPLPVEKSQLLVQQKSNVSLKSSENLERRVSLNSSSSKTVSQVGPQSNSAAHSVQTANKILSAAQRCSALSKEYPMAARRRHEEGTAQVSFQLFPDGQVKQVEVVESTGYSDLDHVAAQAVQNIKCQAAPGQPVIKTIMPVNFSLNKIN